MEQTAIVTAIALFCKFSDTNIPKQTKEICMEKMVNCIIIKDGQTSTKLIEECKKKCQK